jgi:hypothetical protein
MLHIQRQTFPLQTTMAVVHKPRHQYGCC